VIYDSVIGYFPTPNPKKYYICTSFVLVTLVAIGIAVAIVLVLINFKENCNNNSFYFIDDCNNNTSISNPYTGQLSCKIGTKGVKVATIYQKKHALDLL